MRPAAIAARFPCMNTSPNDTETLRTHDPKANPDAITGAPGSHPLGTGAGAASGGLAGAAIGTFAGPVGAVAGAVIGAVAGGLAGKSAGEALNPTIEAAYWRDNHSHQPYADGSTYENYADAYRVGYEGQSKYGTNNRSFEDAETEVMTDYSGANPSVKWPQARPAAQAAWQRRLQAATSGK